MMKTRTKALLSCAALSVSVAGVTLAIVQTQGEPEPPAALVKLGTMLGTASKAAYTDLKRSWYDWDTLQQTVTVKRRERETLASAWSEQIQELSTSYFVTDVRWTCNPLDEIKYLYLAGVYPSGDACIEEWKFTIKTQSGTGYVPIDQRPLPLVKRTEVFRGNQFGHIRALEPDPDRRFVLFLTFENPTVYRVDLPAGTPVVQLTQAQQPYLANAKQIVARNHISEGRQFLLIQDPRWEADLSVPRSTVVLHDADNNGVFESSETVSSSAWTQRGYDNPAVWMPFCSGSPF